MGLTCRARFGGGGALGVALRHLSVAMLPHGPGSDAAAESLAQTVAAEEAKRAAPLATAVRESARQEQVEAQQVLAQAEEGILGRTEALGSDADEPQECLCWSFACCV